MSWLIDQTGVSVVGWVVVVWYYCSLFLILFMQIYVDLILLSDQKHNVYLTKVILKKMKFNSQSSCPFVCWNCPIFICLHCRLLQWCHITICDIWILADWNDISVINLLKLVCKLRISINQNIIERHTIINHRLLSEINYIVTIFVG